MSDVVPVGSKVSTVKVSPQFSTYSKVVVKVSDDEAFVAGTDSGRTLEVSNPWGTQAMANNILARLQGNVSGSAGAYSYQPYDAGGALLNPAAEMGDFINADGVFSGIFTRKRDFGRLMKANVGAPTDEEINHEYQFESPQRREYTRLLGEVKASILVEAGRIDLLTSRTTAAEESISFLSVQADEISAEVSTKLAAEGGEAQKVSWSLLSTEFAVKANDRKVFSVTKDGATIEGTVRATDGVIGGFVIGSKAIYKNIDSFGSDTSTGVYIGTDGIQLGNTFKVTNTGAVTASNLSINGGSISIGDNFSVTSAGNVTANNMTLKGTLYFQNADGTSAGSMGAADLRTGAQQAYTHYGDWNSSYQSTSPGGYCYGGAGGGYRFNKATNSGSGEWPSYFRSGTIFAANSLSAAGSFNFAGYSIGRSSALVIDQTTGNTKLIKYLTW